MPSQPPRSISDRDTFETVTFDLFGTLVHVDDSRLPRMSIDGVSVPSLLAAPIGRLHELAPSVNLGDALVAYFEAKAELRARSDADLDREAPPCAQFARCLERVGIVDETLARELAQAQTEATRRAARLADGALFLLSHLRDRGCALGLVSNLADAPGGRGLLSHLELDRYFDTVVFSGDVGWRKPDRRIFEAALSALHATAPTALHVGDELRADVWGAGRCGLGTVWVNSSGESFEGEYPPRLRTDRLAVLAESGLMVFRHEGQGEAQRDAPDLAAL